MMSLYMELMGLMLVMVLVRVIFFLRNGMVIDGKLRSSIDGFGFGYLIVCFDILVMDILL